MYPYSYSNTIIRGNNESYPASYTTGEDDRFFWAPFVVGGLAGTALGYGIANNNQLNNNNNGQPCCGGYYYPVYQMPYYPNGFNNFNNFYY